MPRTSPKRSRQADASAPAAAGLWATSMISGTPSTARSSNRATGETRSSAARATLASTGRRSASARTTASAQPALRRWCSPGSDVPGRDSGGGAADVDEVDVVRVGERRERGGRVRLPDDQRPAGPADRRLLGRDDRDVGTEPVGVIERDARQHGAVRVPEVDRVEPTAEPDLHDRDVAARLDEQRHRGEGRELEVGQRVGGVVRGRGQPAPFDPGERADDVRVRRLLGSDAHALGEARHVRRRGRPRPVAGRAPDRLQHRHGRALAVGAADDHDGHRRVTETEAFGDPRDARQPELHLARVDGVDPAEPVVERRVRVRRDARGRGPSSPPAVARRRRGVLAHARRTGGLSPRSRRRRAPWKAPVGRRAWRAVARACRASRAGRRSGRSRRARAGTRCSGTPRAASRAPSAR